MSDEKNSLEMKAVEPSVAQHEDSSTTTDSLPSEEQTKRTAINALLIFSCLTVGASSMLFGYDDKVISPIAALEPFVSSQETTLYPILTSLC